MKELLILFVVAVACITAFGATIAHFRGDTIIRISNLPACADGAPEDVVVYRSEVPGAWDSCAPADDLVEEAS